jgi:hypothetical protein
MCESKVQPGQSVVSSLCVRVSIATTKEPGKWRLASLLQLPATMSQENTSLSCVHGPVRLLQSVNGRSQRPTHPLSSWLPWPFLPIVETFAWTFAPRQFLIRCRNKSSEAAYENRVALSQVRSDLELLKSSKLNSPSRIEWGKLSVELASLGYPFLPLQLQPLVSSFYYWNILTYSHTNRLIGIPIRLRSLNLRSGIDVVIVSLPRYGVNHIVRWESGI